MGEGPAGAHEGPGKQNAESDVHKRVNEDDMSTSAERQLFSEVPKH